MAFISVISIFVSPDKVSLDGLDTNSRIIKIIIEFYSSIPDLSIAHFFVFIFICYFYNKFYFKENKQNKIVMFLSIFFSISLVIGYSFLKTNSLKMLFDGNVQIIKTFIKFLGNFFMIYIVIEKLYDYIPNILSKASNINNKYLTNIFEKNPNIWIILILLIVWFPVAIMMYPGIISPDASTQILQVMKPEINLNNHHPILSTLIMGAFISFGELLNNTDIGAYTFVIFQMIFMIYVILYSFKIMRKMNIPNVVQLVALVFYAICPIIHVFLFVVIKDVLFSICMFYYILMLTEIIIDEKVLENKKYLIKVSAFLFIIMMLRNNGIYNIILSFPFLILYFRKYMKKLILVLAIPLILYLIINKVIYPICNIESGSEAEMLSIPFQQTARTLYEGKEYKKEDLDIIDKVLNIEESAKKYNPNLSDNIKGSYVTKGAYNEESTKEEKQEYFKVWFRYLFKYPLTYIEATLNNIYGYLYPDCNCANGVGYFNQSWFNLIEFLNWKKPHNFQDARDCLNIFYDLEEHSPVIGTLLAPGFYNWILIIFSTYTLIIKKQRRYFSIYMVPLSMLLICIASPYLATRYMLTTIYAMPILIINSMFISKNEKEGKKEK